MNLTKFGLISKKITGIIAVLSIGGVCAVHADTGGLGPQPFLPPPTLPHPVDKGPIKGSFVDYNDASHRISIEQTHSRVVISETGKPTLIFDKPGLDDNELEVLWDESGFDSVYRGKSFLEVNYYVPDAENASGKGRDRTISYVYLSDGLLGEEVDGPQNNFDFLHFSPVVSK